MKSFMFATAFLLATSVWAQAETKEFDSAGLKNLEISNQSGKVIITGTDGAKATVVATKHKFSDKCKLKIEKDGEDLEVKVEKTSFGLTDCNVDLEIKAPKNIDVDLDANSGKVVINGIEGKLDFSVGSGAVTAEGKFTEIDGKTGSGPVDIKGAVGGGEVKTGSGNINLTFAQAPTKGAFDLKTGSGTATVLVPKGSKIKTSFAAGSGSVNNELGETPNAPFSVSMKAGSGSLNIKTY